MDSVKLEGERGRDERVGTPGRRQLPGALRAFWICSLAGFALTFIVGWMKYLAGQTQFNWDPLSDPVFGDLMEYPFTYNLLHTSAFFFNLPARPMPYPVFAAVAYPPFAAAVMAPLYAVAIPELLFVAVSVAWLSVVVWWVRGRLVRAGISPVAATFFPLTSVLISFPIERLVHQGNIELVLWIFAAAGAWAYMRDYDDAAAVLWGLAAAMKLFPVILLILLLPRRRWRAFGIGIGTFVGVTVLSLWWLGPTIGVAWRGSLQNVFGYQGVRAAEWSLRELVANHSLINLVKMGALILQFPVANFTLPYYACGALLMGTAFFGKLWKMPVANQLLAVSTFMVMFPPISYYHALVHMYAPLLVLMFLAIRAGQANIHVQGLTLTVMLFVPLFASFTLLTFPRVLLFAGVVQGLVLGMLFLCALQYPFADPRARSSAGVGHESPGCEMI